MPMTLLITILQFIRFAWSVLSKLKQCDLDGNSTHHAKSDIWKQANIDLFSQETLQKTS